MGKRRHAQDKMWVTQKEMVNEWGGKREEHEKLVSALQLLRRLGLTQNLVLSILLQFFIQSFSHTLSF